MAENEENILEQAEVEVAEQATEPVKKEKKEQNIINIILTEIGMILITMI